MLAVRATGLVKRFGAARAVDGVSVSVSAGEVRGLLGPNGAGKTTLLRMLLGLTRPDSGRIELFGRDVADAATTALDGVGGFVEDPAFYPYLSAEANLALLARLDGGAAGRDEIHAVLRRVGLGERAETRVGGFSTGMRQRLGIAGALLRRPRLLLLDEPTSGLDPAGAHAVAALITELAGDGVGVLLSSHQIGELENVCTDYTVMRSGKVVWEGSAAEVRAQAPASGYRLSTSDDARAIEIAAGVAGIQLGGRSDRGIAVAAQTADMDALIVALTEARVYVRTLELLVNPLEALFFALTGSQPAVGAEDEAAAVRTAAAATSGAAG